MCGTQGLAAVLPCFVVYLEVGKALKQKGKRRWLAWAEADGRGEQANTQQAQQAWRRVAQAAGTCLHRLKGGAGWRAWRSWVLTAAGADLPSDCASPCTACATEACHCTCQPALPAAGSPHPLYQQWIEKYGGLEYESLVLQVIHMANEVAAELSDTQVCG